MVSGKEFRTTLRRPNPQNYRIVPAFTIQALQNNTKVQPPPPCNSMKERPLKKTLFRDSYLRGDLPIALQSGGKGISWKADITKLDFHHYLPLFFEGLCETQNPYKFFAQQGIHDLLEHGGVRILPCVPQLIIPIKKALNTRIKSVMCATLKVIQHMVKSGDMVGEALVPYYRQILPVLNMYKEKNVNCGDNLDYSSMRGENLADLINETLEMLEKYGGEDAFINIKYLIPTYESCMMN